MKGFRGFYWLLTEYLSNRSKLFNIVAGRDGKLYEVRNELLGTMITRAETVPELEEVNIGFSYALPKIPHDILLKTVKFFKDYCTKWDQNEVMVQIYWDTIDKKYIVDCPFQSVNGIRIFAQFDKRLKDTKRYVEVCHIHSHNLMDAYFSSIDDENEQAFMLYGVIGRLDTDNPEMQLRVGYNGKYFLVGIDRIFECDTLVSETSVEYPNEWRERVTVLR